MSAPIRIQRRRVKGWKMPPNTVSVTRPGKWGNPFTKGDGLNAAACVAAFRQAMEMQAGPALSAQLSELRGKNLACWCPIVDKDGKPVPCHADILIELSNAP